MRAANLRTPRVHRPHCPRDWEGLGPPDIITRLPHRPEDHQHLREEGTRIFATLYKSLLQASVSSSVNWGNNSSPQGAV